MAELRSLLPLRRALTQVEGAVPSVVPQETRAGGVAGQVAQLWWAQNLLGGMDLRGVDAVLKGFPSPGAFPLAELLRARVAFVRVEEVPAAVAYQRAADVGVAHEGLLYESAQAFLLLGFQEHAKEFLHQLADLGARRAAAWYALAGAAMVDDQSLEARDQFRTGWRLEPSPRAEIFAKPQLVVLLEDLQIRQLTHLGDAEEPVAACPEASRRAIALPAGFEARLLGGCAVGRPSCGCRAAATSLRPGRRKIPPGPGPGSGRRACWRACPPWSRPRARRGRSPSPSCGSGRRMPPRPWRTACAGPTCWP
jgi:hypothetical protein